MTTFEVGDRVRHTAELSDGGTGTVSEIRDKDHLTVRFDTPVSGNRVWQCTPRFLRKVTEPAPIDDKMPFELQVRALSGEWVTIIGGNDRKWVENKARDYTSLYTRIEWRVLPLEPVTTEEYVVQTRAGCRPWYDNICRLDTVEDARYHSDRFATSNDYDDVRIIRRSVTQEVVS